MPIRRCCGGNVLSGYTSTGGASVKSPVAAHPIGGEPRAPQADGAAAVSLEPEAADPQSPRGNLPQAQAEGEPHRQAPTPEEVLARANMVPVRPQTGPGKERT